MTFHLCAVPDCTYLSTGEEKAKENRFAEHRI